MNFSTLSRLPVDSDWPLGRELRTFLEFCKCFINTPSVSSLSSPPGRTHVINTAGPPRHADRGSRIRVRLLGIQSRASINANTGPKAKKAGFKF